MPDDLPRLRHRWLPVLRSDPPPHSKGHTMTTITDSDAALAGTLAMLRTALAVAGLRDDRGTAARLATLIADHTDPTPDVCVNLRCDGIRGAAAYLTSCGETPAGWQFTADEQDHSAPADRAETAARTEGGA